MSIFIFLLFALLLGAIVNYQENNLLMKLEEFLGFPLKKYDCKSMDCYTYDGLSWVCLIYVSIVPIAVFYMVVFDHNNFPAFVGLLFMFCYPPVVLIIRNSTFSDYSIPSEDDPVFDGSKWVAEGPGYNPLYYFLFSFAIGGVSTIWGFSMLNFPDIPFNQGLCLALTGLIFQTLVLFPDVINWVSPVDIRSSKGVMLMSGVTVVIVIFLLVFRAILTSA